MTLQPAAQIAVLMTGHNRRGATLRALAALARQRALPEGTALHTYFVDAGSTDGTPDAVRHAHLGVHLMRVGADVHWGQGMRLASRNSRGADSAPFTHQLWLRTDVTLHHDGLAQLLTVAQEHPDAVVTGALHSPDGTRTTRSGRRGRHLALVEPTGRPEPCDTYDGSVVLLPRAVRERVGDVDRHFPDGMGDHDHGLRARKAGIPRYVAPHHVGTAPSTPHPPDSREHGIPVREALRRLTSPRELPPRAWCVYCLRHGWPWTPVLLFSPYVRTAARAAVARVVR